MIYLAAAYGAVWLLLFAYTFSILNRTRRLQEEVRSLRRALKLDA